MSIGTVVDSDTVSIDDLGEELSAAGAAGAAPEAAAPEAPALLRVVKGDPSPEELAALVAVIAAAGAGGGAPAEDGPLDLWGDRDDALDGRPRMFSPRAYQSGRFGGR